MSFEDDLANHGKMIMDARKREYMAGFRDGQKHAIAVLRLSVDREYDFPEFFREVILQAASSLELALENNLPESLH